MTDEAKRVTGDDGALAVEAAKRADLLDALTDGPSTIGDLECRLDYSRSTIHRAIESFRDQDAVVRVSDGYVLTQFGRALGVETTTYREQVATAARLKALLNGLSPDAPELPLSAFADATITEPDGRRLHLSLRRLRALLSGSDRVRLFSSVVSPVYVDLLYTNVLDGVDVTAVFDPAVVKIIFDEYAGDVREAADAGDFEVRIAEDCPFELFVFDETVAIAAHDEAGHLQAFVEASAPAAYDWAVRLFERYHEAADYATVI
jgi:predicted transcriptional regulator